MQPGATARSLARWGRDAVRRLKVQGLLAEAVRIVVADGTYELAEPLVLTPDDSGTPTCPISYEAAPGAKPCFSGGRPITGFKKGEDGVWTAHLPEVAAGNWYFEQLWVNGRRAVRARSPNKFYHYVLAKVNQAVDPATVSRPIPRTAPSAAGLKTLRR